MNKQQLFSYLDSGVTPFHVVKTMKEALRKAGFIELDEKDAWQLEDNTDYFVVREDSAIVAFRLPSVKQAIDKGFAMVGAHTDSPALKLKPNPTYPKHGTMQLGVEVYGGVLLNTWFDRNLGIAGRISVQTQNGTLTHHLIDSKKAVALLPSLAIHLDGQANTQKSVDAQKHLPVIVGLGSEFSIDTFHKLLISWCSDDIKNAKILGYDLYLYDTQKAAAVGISEEFISASKLDNQLSCFCALNALLASSKTQANMIVCNDHEEIGSNTLVGANGNFLESVCTRIAASQEAYYAMMARSFFISSDNAHAIHPNFADVHDKEHAPIMGEGVVIKHNANQSYTTTSTTHARFKTYALKAGAQTQEYVVRSDMRCGSTVGPMVSSSLGVQSIDVGIPSWAMHSIKESAAFSDVFDMTDILTQFFNQKE